MPRQDVHIFSGYFRDDESARNYFFPVWMPEPQHEVSEQEYMVWERENPKWQFQDDVDSSLDPDFCELSFDISEVANQIDGDDSLTIIMNGVREKDNAFFILGGEAMLSDGSESARKLRGATFSEDIIYLGNFILRI